MTVETGAFAIYNVTLPQKNYSVPQLIIAINTSISSQHADVFSNFSLTIDHDAQTGKFTLTGAKTAGDDGISKIEVLSTTTALRLLGVTDSLSTNGTSSDTKILPFPNAANTNRTKNIYCFTDVFDTENSNNRNDGQTILAKVQAQRFLTK